MGSTKARRTTCNPPSYSTVDLNIHGIFAHSSYNKHIAHGRVKIINQIQDSWSRTRLHNSTFRESDCKALVLIGGTGDNGCYSRALESYNKSQRKIEEADFLISTECLEAKNGVKYIQNNIYYKEASNKQTKDFRVNPLPFCRIAEMARNAQQAVTRYYFPHKALSALPVRP